MNTTNIPIDYVIEQFYTHGGNPENTGKNSHKCSCPICKEGKSWGKKKRCYLLLDKGYIYCHNEQRNYSYIDFIKTVTGLSYLEIITEAGKYDQTNICSKILRMDALETKTNNEKSTSNLLPEDCINLFDKQQVEFYKDNKIVLNCLEYIKKRRLDTAINKPKAYYISLSDTLHKDRLCVPYYDDTGKNILYYQTRAIDDKNTLRYCSKKHGKSSLFGVERIDSSLNYIFLMEGALDSTFVKNGIGMAGLTLTDFQKEQLQKFKFFTKIWILDNQLDNKEVLKKYTKLANENQTIFIWPNSWKDYKDFNEICIDKQLDEIDYNFIIKNSFPGLKVLMELNKIKF